MVDLTSEMTSLWTALGPAPLERGRLVQFVSTRAGEGVSTIAREFSRLAAVRARKPVWLVDADLERQTQLAAAAGEPERFGQVGKVAGASPDGTTFFTVRPALKDREGRIVPDAHLIVARPLLGGRLWITRLRSEVFRVESRAHVLPVPSYWDAMRRHADYIVVDSPSADRSDSAVTLAPFMDATVIVVAAEEAEAPHVAALRDALEATGGRVAGLVFNRARDFAPKILRRRAS